jgi:hypothetical protein
MKNSEHKNRVIDWIDHRLPIFTFLRHQLHEYPTPRNLNYLWNFGSLVGLFEKTRPLPLSVSKPVLLPSRSTV